MEIVILRVVGEIFKSAPRAEIFLAAVVILVIGAIKILPLISGTFCQILSTFLASRSREQTEMMSIIKAELQNHREESSRQFELNERMVKGVEGSLEALRELTARTASMDHRIFEGLSAFQTSTAADHKEIGRSLNKIEGYISGLS